MSHVFTYLFLFLGAYNICSGLEAPSKFTVLDPRGTDATLEFQSTLGGLLTSSQLSEHHVLLGFENSALHCIDLRYPEKPLYKNYDPYVQAVGHIEFNDDKSMFVVSGLTEYVFWPTNARTVLWTLLSSTQIG
jgi:hypothetical protein